MRILLNCIPLLLFISLIACGIGYSLGWKITTIIPFSIASLCTFICSLAWRATPEGIVRNINSSVFIIAALLSASFIFDPSTIKVTWVFMILTVFISIHIFLFELARKSFLFSGARIVLLIIPIVVNTVVVAGLFLWNGNLSIATIGFFIAVIFALMATLFGYKREVNGK